MCKSAYAMGGRSRRACACDGGGVKVLPFQCVRTNWMTPNLIIRGTTITIRSFWN